MAPKVEPVLWTESSWSGIRVSDDPDVWHSGKVIDLLAVGDDRLLAGTETGGVWLSEGTTNWPGSIGCITTSDYESNEDHRNFEALVFWPSSERAPLGIVAHYFWNQPTGRWDQTAMLTRDALGPAAVIQGDYVKGAAHHNLEALVWERDTHTGLAVSRHWWRDDSNGVGAWTRGDVVTARPAGPGSMIRGDFHSDDDHGNLEAIVVEADNEVWHKWRNGLSMTWVSGGTAT